MRLAATVLTAVVLAGATACGAGPERIDPTGIDGLVVPMPDPEPDDFVGGIDNEYLPLEPGARWTYRRTGAGRATTVTVSVASTPRDVLGVQTTVVMSRETRGRRVLAERADLYAQDVAGNVWHFGADVSSDDRDDRDDPGSWEAGVAGAQAGLAMPAEPRLGDGFARVAASGVVEEHAEVRSVDDELTVGATRLRDLVQLDITGSGDPGLVHRAHFAPGVGLVRWEALTVPSEVLELESRRSA